LFNFQGTLMAKNKEIRALIVLECINCRQKDNSNYKVKTGVSRYFTTKNRRNNPERILLKKYCSICDKHTTHNEIK
jgi:large subunit ribosomal protein L33